MEGHEVLPVDTVKCVSTCALHSLSEGFKYYAFNVLVKKNEVFWGVFNGFTKLLPLMFAVVLGKKCGFMIL